MSSATTDRTIPAAARADAPHASPDTAGRETTADLPTLLEKRRLLLLVRTGLSLALGYMLIFSAATAAPPQLIVFVILYLASNIIIALVPRRVLARASFDFGLILVDTAAISFALLLIPDTNTDVFVFYFIIILLASISDRMMLSLLAPIVTSGAYLAFLFTRNGMAEVLQPAVLLRLPFFLLTGTFYGFFVDRVRRGQLAVAAAKQRAQARTELLSLITHDLKQPLWVATQSGALLYDQLTREKQDRTSTRELAAQVMVNLRRMESLTLNFLDLSRMESRGLQMTPCRAPLNRLVEDLLDAYRPALDLKNIRVELELAPALPAAWIDPIQAERGISNLLDNAIKFTPTGGTVTCRTAAQGNWLTLTIGDSGPGIKPDREATLFARFQDGAAAGGRQSTGLGLHIARAIAEALGGALSLDRSAPQGAWFCLRLPAASGGAEISPEHVPQAAVQGQIA
jgi:signal transduction histidine kinase